MGVRSGESNFDSDLPQAPIENTPQAYGNSTIKIADDVHESEWLWPKNEVFSIPTHSV